MFDLRSCKLETSVEVDACFTFFRMRRLWPDLRGEGGLASTGLRVTSTCIGEGRAETDGQWWIITGAHTAEGIEGGWVVDGGVGG